MLDIFIPDNFAPERIYILDIFFEYILGLKYEFRKYDLQHYRILLPNGRELIVEDHFFSGIDEKNGYLNEIYIPDKISFFHNDKFADGYIPVLFGDASRVIYNEHSLSIGSDIFASAFYMLTRWEEYISESKDDHDRFPAAESLGYKNNFLDRPIVNEYAELLWNLISYLGFNEERKEKTYRVIPTHDIDQIQYWDLKRRTHLIKNLTGDIFIRKKPALFIRRLWSFITTMAGADDPCFTFEFLMDKAESINCQAYFYIIAGGETTYDKNYSINTGKIREEVVNIENRGHIIGIHPSYNAYKNSDIINKECSDLEKISCNQITEGRNHYLRFEVPSTWQKLEQSGIKTDSSMYYTETPGFRCGICNEFPVFDILQRKRLNITERPLIVMDTSFANEAYEKVYSEITKLKNSVRKYKGDFVFLWHNSNIDTPEWRSYRRIFEEAFYGK